MQVLKILGVYLFILNVALTTQAEVTLYSLSASAFSADGVSCPRNNQTFYRGTTDAQMNLNKALSAMMGDSASVVETFYFSAIKNRLMGIDNSYGITIEPFQLHRIDEAIKGNGGNLILRDAVKVTQSIVDEYFDYLVKKNYVINNYVNYRSQTFKDWPREIVFMSLVSPAAATYGDRLLVINEKSARSIDMNCWNKKNNGVWYDHTRDIGEFAAFGYLPASDIVGYQVREGTEKFWHNIRYALYRVKFEGKRAVAIYDGRREDGAYSSCMVQDSATEDIYHCNYSPGHIELEPLKPSREKARLIAYVVKDKKSLQMSLQRKKSLAEAERTSTFDDYSIETTIINEIIAAINL